MDRFQDMKLTQIAERIARDEVLLDPTDDEIIVAVAEAKFGHWPKAGIDRWMCDEIIRAYNKAEKLMRREAT